MATGNPILGTAKGSIGDVVLSRRNGKQVSRIRIREIANPKTIAQGTQRMRIASLTRFYSPFSSCLAKAFEGKNRSKSYSKFLSVNARRAAALNFSVPKDGGLCPIPVQVSQGTMPSPVVSYAGDNEFSVQLNAGETITTFGQLSQRFIDAYGLKDGDQLTFVGVFAEGDSYFADYQRIFLNASSTESVATSLGRFAFFFSADAPFKVGGIDDNLVGFALVFSRWQAGKWRRSNSIMACVDDDASVMYYGDAAFDAFIDGWIASRSANAPVGTVYLDGEGETNAFEFQTMGGTTVTAVRVIQVTENYAETEGGQATPHTVYKAIDANGNQYFLYNHNTQSDDYGKVFSPVSTGGYAVRPPYGVQPDKELTASPGITESTLEYRVAIFNWLLANGVSIPCLSNNIDTISQ